jgi:hypothetical protein
MADPKPPLPDEFNDPQIDRVLGDAEMHDINKMIDGAAGSDSFEDGYYREPDDVESHNALRDSMLEQYYHYKDAENGIRVIPGEHFEPAEDLDDLLNQIKVVTDEWHRELGPDDSAEIIRNEGVRVLELPLIQSLAVRKIPVLKIGKVIEILDEYVRVGDDDRAKKEAMDLLARLN